MDAELASRIMGEAGICSPLVLLAAAWVCSRSACFASATPSPMVLWIASNYQWLLDPSVGATMMFSTADLQKPLVRALTRNKSPTLVAECNWGYKLWFYR